MKIILANPAHDVQLRNIVRSESMPGHIQVAYEREPSFLQGLETQGTFNQVIAAEEDGKILLFGCRSIRPMFINGERIDFGYLSSLRSTPLAKQKLGVARSYKTLREVHEDGRCLGYISTIINGNVEAVSTLTHGRAGLPYYKNMGTCRTVAIPLRKRKHASHPNISIRFAKPGGGALVVRLLENFGKQNQFFPALTKSDFGTPLLRDLPITQFLIAEQNGEACGIAALWDQSKFKQHRIRKYSPALRLAKPFLNGGLKLAGYSPMPKEGEQLKNAYFCFKAARNHNPKILQALLHHACNHLHQAGYSHCITGFHNDDPATSIVKHYPATTYRSRLFFTGWENDLKTFDQLDGRVLYFDPAIL